MTMRASVSGRCVVLSMTLPVTDPVCALKAASGTLSKAINAKPTRRTTTGTACITTSWGAGGGETNAGANAAAPHRRAHSPWQLHAPTPMRQGMPYVTVRQYRHKYRRSFNATGLSRLNQNDIFDASFPLKSG